MFAIIHFLSCGPKVGRNKKDRERIKNCFPCLKGLYCPPREFINADSIPTYITFQVISTDICFLSHLLLLTCDSICTSENKIMF